MPYLLAINCGSSSIKGKLFSIPPTQSEELETVANVSVSNISSKGEKVKIAIDWEEGKGENSSEEADDGDKVDYESLVPLLLDHLTKSGSLKKDEIRYITHRVVHGGTHKSGIKIWHGHEEGLGEMDKLSEFAPLHNHHAVLAVRACLDALPEHTSYLVFDTLFHQTIPPEVYTYALPPPEKELAMPLRKYGFHGLSYASIVSTLSQHRNKPEDQINIVVAHLGSGASAACIKGGKSYDTSMGLTPLEGLIGGTRSGTIDPTAIFHHTAGAAEDAGLGEIGVTKAEVILNKKSGLAALAGTSNFGTIISRLDPSKCSKEENERAKLAYGVFLDRVMAYISQYLFKLLSTIPLEQIDGIVFSGGIGEKGSQLRADVIKKLGWLGAVLNEERNEEKHGKVRLITEENSKLKAYVVETDEEGWSAKLARDEFGF